jgi:uncharacterized membrane protein YhaH (DUF805 family)
MAEAGAMYWATIALYVVVIIGLAYLLVWIGMTIVKGTWALGRWIFHNKEANPFLQLAMIPVWLVLGIITLAILVSQALILASNLRDAKNWWGK